VLVPARPGITNAIGCVVADLRHDFVRTINTPLDALEPGRVAAILREQGDEGTRLIAKERIAISATRQLYSLDMQFIGQTHLLRVPLSDPDPDRATLQSLFENAYFDRFRVRLDTIRANVVNVNTSVIGTRAALDLSALLDPASRKSSLDQARTGARPVFFDGTWHDTPIYRREHLPAAFALTGPAILDQMDTTVLIEPGDRAQADRDGNLIITIGPRHDP
jgi:N-methylhydantoinase A